jgi:hypothetical protein
LGGDLIAYGDRDDIWARGKLVRAELHLFSSLRSYCFYE